jgi:sortase (surface protein transpeptidase)
MDKTNKFKVTSKKKYIPKIIWAVLAILAAIFIIRVALWEKSYYESKEGSERAIAPAVGDMNPAAVEVDETDVTETQKNEYKVAANRPRYMTIEKIGVYNARVVEISINQNSQLDTPVSIFDAGWYNESSIPGTGGVSIFDGHNGGPTKVGIFKNLPKLIAGDIITIEMGNGEKINYRVYENKTVALDKADAEMKNMRITPVQGTESISIISCTGDWSDVQKTYLSRQFLRATRI